MLPASQLTVRTVSLLYIQSTKYKFYTETEWKKQGVVFKQGGNYTILKIKSLPIMMLAYVTVSQSAIKIRHF